MEEVGGEEGLLLRRAEEEDGEKGRKQGGEKLTGGLCQP